MFYISVDKIDYGFNPTFKNVVIAAHGFEKLGNRVAIESAFQAFSEPVLDGRELIYYTHRFDDSTNLVYNGASIYKLSQINDIKTCDIRLIKLYDSAFNYDIRITSKVIQHPNWVKNGF